jgi:hypothetical protein
MSEESIRRDLATEPSLRRLIAETAPAPVSGLGVIPEGHEGPYRPTPDELLESARHLIQADAELASVRAELAVYEQRGATAKREDSQ